MLNNLEPARVWHFFYEISALPRPSKQEQRVIEYLKSFSKERGLECEVDQVGNVLITKLATDVSRNNLTIVLQSHLDMVCEKEPTSNHNFYTDPITLVYKDGWISARGTTLGADNGIGVAAMLAVLDSSTIKHGIIKALFTIDEETALTGATALTPQFISGKYLLNLDSEDDGEIYIGCAGGIDTVATLHLKKSELINANLFGFKLTISGLTGGHSGDDIGKGRQSSMVLLAQILKELNSHFSISIASINGGNLRNAIAREAEAIIFIDKRYKEDVRVEFNILLSELEDWISKNDPNAKITLQSCSYNGNLFSSDDSAIIINLINSIPHGVIEWSESLAGFVKTSTNFASVKLTEDALIFTTSQRSSSQESKDKLAITIRNIFEEFGCYVIHENEYPGWESDLKMNLIQEAKTIYGNIFGLQPKIKEIHAGLECGVIASKNRELQIISFGPTIRDAHSPSERIEVKTVERFWVFLCALLEKLL